ncbi:hypothetical protein CSC82_06810 [Rhodobacteraceae bacterium 4F10]|nr:hypothetical protein CSC82_06810 [Rhodobacteraceae bacterium 4F10]
MAAVFLVLLAIPLVIGAVASFFFGWVGRSYGKAALVVVGSVWVAALIFWLFRNEQICGLAHSQSDNGCGFVSFLSPLEQISIGSAGLFSSVALVYWLRKLRTLP